MDTSGRFWTHLAAILFFESQRTESATFESRRAASSTFASRVSRQWPIDIYMRSDSVCEGAMNMTSEYKHRRGSGSIYLQRPASRRCSRWCPGRGAETRETSSGRTWHVRRCNVDCARHRCVVALRRCGSNLKRAEYVAKPPLCFFGVSLSAPICSAPMAKLSM